MGGCREDLWGLLWSQSVAEWSEWDWCLAKNRNSITAGQSPHQAGAWALPSAGCFPYTDSQGKTSTLPIPYIPLWQSKILISNRIIIYSSNPLVHWTFPLDVLETLQILHVKCWCWGSQKQWTWVPSCTRPGLQEYQAGPVVGELKRLSRTKKT